MSDREPTILVVEDNPLSLKMARVALEAEGFVVLAAPDGRTALELMATARPDLIVQDVKLPDLDGVELLDRLRRLPGGADLPIIALTGYRSEVEHLRNAGAGFTDLLFKPVEPSLLLRVIRTNLQPQASLIETPGVQHRLLVVDDDPVQLKLSRAHFAAAGFRVTTADDGLEALECARRTPPDVIVSDVLMPGLDGFRLCAQVKGDVTLASVPVVLTSSAFVEREDAALALDAGAEALVQRTPGHQDLIAAVSRALQAPRARGGARPEGLSAERYAERVIRQLEQQVRLNGSLSQRLAQRRAELAVLTAAAEAITADRHAAPTLGQVLHQAFNACGISRGAVYLRHDDGSLSLEAMVGYNEEQRPAVAGFFGRAELLRAAVSAPDPGIVEDLTGGLGPVILTPLRLGPAYQGVLWLETDAGAGSPAEWFPFAVAVASQLAQAVALSGAYEAAAAGREATQRDEMRRQQLQIKDEFLSHVSHELRTPLTALHQFITILRDGLGGPLTPDQARYLDIALRNVNELRLMIDGLLEATRSESSRLSIHLEPLQLPEVVAGALASLEPSAREKGVTLSVEALPELPLVRADAIRVGQVMSNLVGNGIKFTPRGGEVSIRMGAAPDDPAMVRVSVADTGPGIAAEERERIFEYLYQSRNTLELTRKGFGIGLHICRDLVTRQGGRIWCDSEPGQGSVFHFTLPSAAPPVARGETTELSASEAG